MGAQKGSFPFWKRTVLVNKKLHVQESPFAGVEAVEELLPSALVLQGGGGGVWNWMVVSGEAEPALFSLAVVFSHYLVAVTKVDVGVLQRRGLFRELLFITKRRREVGGMV